MKYRWLGSILLLFCATSAYAQVGSPCTCASGQAGRCLTGSATITQPGFYCVTQDFTSNSEFTIAADNVTLDGQGHKMTIASGKFLEIQKGLDPALPSFHIRTFNVVVKNFNVISRNVPFNDMIGLDTVSNSTIENVTLKLIGGTSNTGAKLMGMYQSYLNRFIGNTFIMSGPSGPLDFFSIRNGTCGTQFINNTFVGVNLPNGSHFLKLNSGDQTLGRGAVADTIFSGNRIYSNIDGILDQSHEGGSGVTLTNNLIYSEDEGFSGGAGQKGWYEFSGNTIISKSGKPIHIDGGDGKEITLGMKNNILFANAGALVVDMHVETINSNYNNLFTTSANGPLIWSRYDGRGAILGTPLLNCLSGCGAAWKLPWRDNNSVSVGPNLAALFVDPNVVLTMDPSDNVTNLGNFNLKPNSGLVGIGEGGVNLGSSGLNGLNYPLQCSVPKPGLISGDSMAPAQPSGLTLSP